MFISTSNLAHVADTDHQTQIARNIVLSHLETVSVMRRVIR